MALLQFFSIYKSSQEIKHNQYNIKTVQYVLESESLFTRNPIDPLYTILRYLGPKIPCMIITVKNIASQLFVYMIRRMWEIDLTRNRWQIPVQMYVKSAAKWINQSISIITSIIITIVHYVCLIISLSLLQVLIWRLIYKREKLNKTTSTLELQISLT